jgi:hypothetical protein
MHSWPPEVRVPEEWAEPFFRLAHEIGMPIQDVHEAAAGLREWIAEIDRAK